MYRLRAQVASDSPFPAGTGAVRSPAVSAEGDHCSSVTAPERGRTIQRK